MTSSETGDISSGGFVGGSELYQKRAAAALPLLVRQAKAEQPIFYSQLAAELRMPNARNLDYVLGAIGDELIALSTRWGIEVPAIQCLVVNKQTGLPGDGIAWFVPEPEEFRKSTPQQRRRIMDAILYSVYAFPSWDRVLTEFGLEPVKSGVAAIPVSSFPGSGRGAGEGEDHLALKTHVAMHPETVGLPHSCSTGKTEYEFASADVLDVLFTNGTEWVGAEIKGPRSDDADVLRGMFQCIKYRALLEAQQKFEQQRVNARVVLVLGRAFPDSLLWLKHTLGLDIIDNISVPKALAAHPSAL